MERLTGAWQVRAGLIPGTPMEEYGKIFPYTSTMREQDESAEKEPCPWAALNNYCRVQAEAMAYFRQLNDPRILNWAEITWIWY